jgi:tetratricopeptide (TPR) repeat protein
MAEKASQLDEKLKDALPPLQDILSLKVDDEDYVKLDPTLKRMKTFEAIRDVLVRESQDGPVVLAIEDLHWIDRTTEELLDYLIGFLPHSRILLLLLYRPEYTHQWGSKSFYSQIGVDQLSLASSAELVQSILEDGQVAPELREVILTRAAGNPLFMEEFTHTLLENGSIVKQDHQYVLSRKATEIQVPDTIQGIIAARMDRLEDTLKRTMQVASVIGRDFAYRILQTITGMREELKSHLLNLQGLEFIYEKSLFPELEYIFKHALTQEVAYNSLLLKRRKEIHEKIGKAIEEIYADRLEEFYEMLAHHYSKSENLEKAYEYLSLSSVKTGSRNALWESIRLGMEAIDVLRRMPGTDENKRRGVEMRLMLSGPLGGQGFPGDALQVMEEGAVLAEELGDDTSLANLWGTLSLYHSSRGDALRGYEFAKKAFRAAERSGDPELVGTNGFELCWACEYKGDYSRIVEVAPTILDVLAKAGMQRRWDVGKYYNLNLYSTILAYQGVSLGYLGDFEKGDALLQEAWHLAEEIGNLTTLPGPQMQRGAALIVKGDGRGALGHVEKAIGYAEQADMPILLWIASTLLGHAYYLLGDLDTARRHFEERNEIYRTTAFSGWVSWNHYGLGMVCLDCGDLDGARRHIEESLEFCRRGGDRAREGHSTVALGKVIGKADPARSAEAEGHILQGIRMLEEMKLRPWLAEGYLFLGELYADSGQPDKALETLKKAEAEFRGMGMDYWLRRTQEALESIQIL